MSRQLIFSSTISVMLMASFVLSATIRAQDPWSSITYFEPMSGR